MRRWVTLVVFTLDACAHAPAPARVPASLEVPPGNVPVLELAARGDQIYRCGTGWALVGPDAELFDIETHQPRGKHTVGPTWTASDGSEVQGTKIAAETVAPDAIPWLLLKATPRGAPGALSGVTFIQRLNTQGGVAPSTGCDTNKTGTEVRVSYTATYRFFRAE
jgi:hypothetical protein